MITNPYAEGTANSKLFRIPAIYTLRSGRIIACADIRYGNGTDDPANIETALRYSDDNGKTWSDVQFVNHFDDMEDADHNEAIPTSASFVDAAICEFEDNVVFHVCDACPAYMGLWSAGTYGKGNGYIDGHLAICDKTREDNAESTKLDKEHYPYYIGDFENGYAPVLKFSDNTVYNNYYVDEDYKVFLKDGNGLSPVMIKQMKKDGTLSDKDIQANIFYAYSPIKMYPTYYLWVKKSTDGGETFGKGKIINLQVNSKGFTGFAPGRGITIEKKGKKRIIFALYDNNDTREFTSVVYSDDGENWQRSEKASKVGLSGKSSETQLVMMNNNVLRMYSRNIAKYVSYCDSTDFGETWGEYSLDKGLHYCSNCMVSFINYSKEIDGKKVIVAAVPDKKIRKGGVIKLGLYGENNKVTWKYQKKVTESLLPFSYVYSCVTETSEGKILDLYESDKAEISLKEYSLDELMVKENLKLGLFDFIKSKKYNVTKK